MHSSLYSVLFFFTDTATTMIYTLSLHDALPICPAIRISVQNGSAFQMCVSIAMPRASAGMAMLTRSEEHTSELQSHSDLVCRLLLEKKKNNNKDDVRLNYL